MNTENKLNKRASQIVRQEGVSDTGASRLARRKPFITSPLHRKDSTLKNTLLGTASLVALSLVIMFSSCNESKDITNGPETLQRSPVSFRSVFSFQSITDGMTMIDQSEITNLRIDSVGPLLTGVSVRTDGTVELSGLVANSNLEAYLAAVGFDTTSSFGALTAPVGFAPAISSGDTWQSIIVDGSYTIVSLDGTLATVDVRTNGSVEQLRMLVTQKDLIATLSTSYFQLEEKIPEQ